MILQSVADQQVSQPPGVVVQLSPAVQPAGHVGAATHESVPVQLTSHAHELAQDTPLAHESLPLQATLHALVPQTMAPLHELLLSQITPQVAAATQLTPPMQALLPQLTVQAPLPHCTWPRQELVPSHATLQPAAAAQLTPALHELEPPQSTSQSPAPHVTALSQLPWPVHWTVHPVAFVQSTPPGQLVEVVHKTSHGRPAGHTTVAAHPVAQSMMQVPPTHVSQPGGQGPASGAFGSASAGVASGIVRSASGCSGSASAVAASIVERVQRSPTHSKPDGHGSSREQRKFVSSKLASTEHPVTPTTIIVVTSLHTQFIEVWQSRADDAAAVVVVEAQCARAGNGVVGCAAQLDSAARQKRRRRRGA